MIIIAKNKSTIYKTFLFSQENIRIIIYEKSYIYIPENEM